MKFHIRIAALILTALFFLSSCGDDGKYSVETDADGRPVFQTDDLGETLYPVDKEGVPIPIFTDDEGKLIVFTDSKGEYTPFTDINGGKIPYITNCSGEILRDSSGFPLTEASTRDPLMPKSDVKVGFIYNGAVNGDTLNKAFENARQDMWRSFGVETCYIENVLVQQFEEAVDILKQEGCNIIVAASNHYITAANLVARNERDGTKYIVFGSSNYSTNQASIRPLLYQPANVCGIVAAYNTVNNKIGIVADNNFYNVETVVNAFTLGVGELPNSKVEVRLNWALSDAWSDTARAIDDLVAEGCDVIFLYQATEYGIRYCESIGVKNIGFSYQMADIAPRTFLTSFYVNMNIFLNDKVSAARNDNFDGESILGGLTSKTAVMGNLNENLCKQGSDEITKTLYDFVYNETSLVFTGEIRDQAGAVRVDKGAHLTKEQILNIDWLIRQIETIKNFSDPRSEDEIFFSDLAVRS